MGNRTTRKLPQHTNIDHHKLGEIVFFSTNLGIDDKNRLIGPTNDQRFIRAFMSMVLFKDHGRNWLTHVGVFCDEEIDQTTGKKKIYIAHVTEKGDETVHSDRIKRGLIKPDEEDPEYTLGYVKEPVDELLERDKDRSFISFYPNGKSLLAKIESYFGSEFVKLHNLTEEKVANDFSVHISNCTNIEKNNDLNKIKWRYFAGVRAFLHRSKLNADRLISINKSKEQNESEICSGFGAKALKKAALEYFKELYSQAQQDIKNNEIAQENMPNIKVEIDLKNLKVKARDIPGYPSIHSRSTPKAFYNHLYQHPDYDEISCYLGKKPIDRLSSCLTILFNQLYNSKLTIIQIESLKEAQLILIRKTIQAKEKSSKENINETELCVYILYKVLPLIRNINKLAYKKALEIAEGMCIDIRDIRQYQKTRSMLKSDSTVLVETKDYAIKNKDKKGLIKYNNQNSANKTANIIQSLSSYRKKNRLTPNALYSALIGKLERETLKNNKNKRFVLKATIPGSPTESGRIYFDKVKKCYVAVHYPGVDRKSSEDHQTYDNRDASIGQIKQAMDEAMSSLPKLTNPSLSFSPIFESRLGRAHVIAAWTNEGRPHIEDSISSLSRAYPLDRIKKVLFGEQGKSVNPVYRGWQALSNDWECGYYTYAAFERLLDSPNKPVTEKPIIDDTLFNRMEANAKVFSDENKKGHESSRESIDFPDEDERADEAQDAAPAANKQDIGGPESVALLDLDHTLIAFPAGDSVTVLINQPLLNALKAKGTTDVYFFTDMTFNPSNMQSRRKAIEALEKQGITVHGVITPNDYLWNPESRGQLKNFNMDFIDFANTHNINLRNRQNTDQVSRFFNGRHTLYKKFLHTSPRELPELGIAYKEASLANYNDKDFYSTYTEPSTYAKFAADASAAAGNLPDGKSLMLLHFLKKAPSSIKNVIFFDDKEEKIEACAQAVKDWKPAMTVSAYHTQGINGNTLAVPNSLTSTIHEEEYLAVMEQHQNKFNKNKNNAVTISPQLEQIRNKYFKQFKDENFTTTKERAYFDSYITKNKDTIFLDQNKDIVLFEEALKKAYHYTKSQIWFDSLKNESVYFLLSDGNKTAFESFLKAYGYPCDDAKLQPKETNYEVVGLAALIYADDPERGIANAPGYIKKTQAFIEQKQGLLAILQRSMDRSQASIEALTNNRVSKTFMDLTKVTRLKASEEKLKILKETSEHVKQTIFTPQDLQKVTKLLKEGKFSLWQDVSQKGTHGEIIHTNRAFSWRKPTLVCDLEKFYNTLLATEGNFTPSATKR